MTGLVVTFDSTADAMRAEELFKEKGIPGRIIPVPPRIHAECGLAWRTELCAREGIEALAGKDLRIAGIYEYEFRF